MTTARMTRIMAAITLGLATMTGAAEPQKPAQPAGEKPVIACKEILESYKITKSVDETADSLSVDQSQVVACLKAAGIKQPNEYDK